MAMVQRGLPAGVRRLAAALALVMALVPVACSSGEGAAEDPPSSATVSGGDVAAGRRPTEKPGEVIVDAATGTASAGPPVGGSEGASGGTGAGTGADQAGADTGTTVASGAADLGGAELEAFVVERYMAYWNALDAARRAPTEQPSVDFPLLAELAAGHQLETSYQTIIDLARSGEAIREPAEPSVSGVDAAAEHRVRVDRIDGTVAELSVCVVNDDVRHVVADDAIVGDNVTTVRSMATMALTDGRWKLIRAQAIEMADGVTGCWLAPDSEFPH